MQGLSVVANVVRVAAVTAITSQSDALLTSDGRIGATTRLDAVRRNGDSSLEGSINLFDHQGPSAGSGRKIRRAADGTPVSAAEAEFTNPNHGIKASAQAERPQLGGLLRLKGSLIWGLN